MYEEKPVGTNDWLVKFTGIVENLVVNDDRMLENLTKSGGVFFSGRLLLELIDKGLTRNDAYDHVQRVAFKAKTDGISFKDALFGEHLWGRTPRDTVFCSEGGFKSLALERATNGAPVAGIGGSELRPAHARKLATFKRVVWVRDHGDAGAKIAEVVENAVARHCEVVNVALPDERDADALPLGELRAALA